MLVVEVCAEGARRTYSLTQGTSWIIGRAKHCQIQIPSDKHISKEHAEIRAVDGHLQLRKTSGSNPIFSNSRPVDQMDLVDGSTFFIGSTQFTVLEVAADAAAKSCSLDSARILNETVRRSPGAGIGGTG